MRNLIKLISLIVVFFISNGLNIANAHNHFPITTVSKPLDGSGHTWHHDDKTLHAIIKYGLAKLVKNYEGKMIGFEDKLSDKEIDSVLAYMKSYWSKENYEYQLKLN